MEERAHRHADAGAGERSSAPRRVLGDAWQDWDHSLENLEAEIHTGPGLFLLFAFIVTLLATAGWMFLVWLAEPRLVSLGLPAGGVVAVRFGGAGLLFLPPLLLGGLLANIRYPRAVAGGLLWFIVFGWSLAEALARCLRLSRDRLGHSFIHLANRLSLLSEKTGSGEELLVLAPRCLRPELLKGLRQMATDAGAQFAVVGGGEQALATVEEIAPAAVLAVACERDLVAGIRDVAPRLTVLGLANRRPEGPCRNSEIDLTEARRLLETLAGLARRRR